MRSIGYIASILALLVLGVFISLYLKATIYTYPEPGPFNGSEWYNPYDSPGTHQLRANFHAHTKSWAGITFGNNTEKELVDAYDDKGYDIIGLSNYHRISTYHESSELYIPMYEHGLNLKKVHNLVINAQRVLFPGYPVHFTLHQSQHMIQRTATVSTLNAIAHPTMPIRDIERLCGYDLMEVGNTLGMAVEHWDAALSNGRLVWCISDDDTHDLILEPTFIKWTMIYADQKKAESALQSLYAGSHYGVESYHGECENYSIQQVSIVNDTLHISMSNPVNRIDLYGQNGSQRMSVVKQDAIAYPLKEDDTYIRGEIHMDDCVYYLNPVVRYTGGEIATARALQPKVNTTGTWLTRIVVALLLLGCLFMIRRQFNLLRQTRKS